MTIGYSIDHTEDVKGQESNLHATRDVRAANGQSSSSYCSDLSLVDFQWGRLTTRRFTQSWRSRALTVSTVENTTGVSCTYGQGLGVV